MNNSQAVSFLNMNIFVDNFTSYCMN